ncbi:DUF2141 domain-containing protein [Sphingomonas sp. MMS24-JH45]
MRSSTPSPAFQKEGFGFSRNPAIRFGPPRFAAARFRSRVSPKRNRSGCDTSSDGP